MSRLKIGFTLLLGALLGAALVLGTAEGAGSSVVARVLAFTNASYPLGAAPTGGQVLCLSSGVVTGCTAGGAATVTVSSSTATLGATDSLVEVTASATNITLAEASSASVSQQVTIHCARSSACLIQLTRAGGDTIDAATSRAGMVPPGRSILAVRTSASTWTSTLDIDPRPAMLAHVWLPDASTSNLSGTGSGWATNGTAAMVTAGGVTAAGLSRSSSVAQQGWTGSTKITYSDGAPAYAVLGYNSAPLSSSERLWVVLADGWYSGTRAGWGGNGFGLQFEGGDTTWRAVVRGGGTLSTANTGASVAAGYFLGLAYRDGADLRYVIYTSATDATFSGVTPTVGRTTPTSWPSATTLQALIYGEPGSAWTGTLAVAWAAAGTMR